MDDEAFCFFFYVGAFCLRSLHVFSGSWRTDCMAYFGDSAPSAVGGFASSICDRSLLYSLSASVGAWSAPSEPSKSRIHVLIIRCPICYKSHELVRLQYIIGLLVLVWAKVTLASTIGWWGVMALRCWSSADYYAYLITNIPVPGSKY